MITGTPALPNSSSASVPCNGTKAVWPETDYIVGNPPFVGSVRIRDALGDGYTETVRTVHSDVGESSDFVMYWWNHAPELARAAKIQRFGFITTNSLRQTFNRRVRETHLTTKPPLSLLFAIPDHLWVDSVDGAAGGCTNATVSLALRESPRISPETRARVRDSMRPGQRPSLLGFAPLRFSD